MTRTFRKLLIECPVSQEMVFTGRIVREVDLERGGIRGSSFRCPACHETHAWEMHSTHAVPANLLRAAETVRGW